MSFLGYVFAPKKIFAVAQKKFRRCLKKISPLPKKVKWFLGFLKGGALNEKSRTVIETCPALRGVF